MKKYFEKAKGLILTLALVVAFAFPAGAVYWDITGTNLLLKGFLELPEISTSTPGTPGATSWRMYTYNDGFYIIDDAGTPTNLLASTTLDAAYTGGNTITLDASGDVEFDLSVTARNVIISNTFAGTQAVGLEIDAEVAQLITDGILFSTTAGTITDAIDASDASITNAINVGGNVIIGALASIDFTEFDVSGTTGAIIINDDGDLGSITIEGSVLDINSLDFVGAAAITAGASSAITINPNAGNVAGEDLIITAHNIALTAAGAMDLTPDGAVTLAIDLTDANYTNAISVGTNAILGTTGAVTYNNWSVNADGDFTGVDATFSGTVNVGAWAQDAIVPASASPQALTIDGGGSGAVVIAGTSTGTLWLGDDSGGTTLVTVGNGTDLLLGEGTLTIDNDQNEDALVITSSATTQSAIEITNAATTTGKMIQANADDLGTAGVMLYLDSDNIAADNYYIGLFDGSGAYNFSVSQYGATVIEGNSTSDVLTLTAGDLQIDDGIFEVDTDEDVTSYIERAQATVTGHLLSLIEQTDTVASSKAVLFIDQDTNSTPSSAIEIDTEGAYAIKIDALVAAGDGILVDVADSYTGQWFIADAGPWLGTTSEGFWSFQSDVAATQEVGQVIRIDLRGTGTAGTAVEGKAFHAESNAAAKTGESLVYLDTLTNTAIHIENGGVAADGIKFDVENSYTGQGILFDGGPWLGTAGEGGVIDFETDSVGTAEAGMAIRLNFRGTAADAAGISGKGIYVKDTAGATAASYLAHFESTNNGALIAIGDLDISAAPMVGASPIIMEGNTEDASELTIALTDPERDVTLTIPDSPIATGDFPIVLGVGTTQTSQAGTGTADVTGSSITLQANHAAAGQVYEWEVSGTKTGANVAMIVHLYILDAQVLSLTATDAAAVEWLARIKVFITGGAIQEVYGELICNGKVTVFDVDVTTAKDLATAGGAMKLQIQSQNGGDTVTSEQVTVTYNE